MQDTFETKPSKMDLFAWEEVHISKDADQAQGSRKAGKQRKEAAKHVSRKRSTKKAGPQGSMETKSGEAAKQETREARQREAGKRKQGSREAAKL